MLIINICLLLLSLAVLYNIYSQGKHNSQLIKSNKDNIDYIVENNSAFLKAMKADNEWQLAAIKRYLGEELGKVHHIPLKRAPVTPKRQYRAKNKRKPLSEEQRLALSLRSKERWAKYREQKQQGTV